MIARPHRIVVFMEKLYPMIQYCNSTGIMPFSCTECDLTFTNDPIYEKYNKLRHKIQILSPWYGKGMFTHRI